MKVLWITLPVVLTALVWFYRNGFVEFFRILGDIATMMKAKTSSGVVAPGIIALSHGYVNVWLVETDSGYLAIDAGVNPKHMRRTLQQMRVPAESVHTVLLTHSDSDHRGGLSVLRNAEVFASVEEAAFLRGAKKRTIINNHLKVNNRIDRTVSPLTDGQTLELDGATVRCILTPGHTTGSMSFLVNDRWLFVGDTISIQDGRIEPFMPSICMDSTQNAQSAARIRDMLRDNPTWTVLSGHHGYVKGKEA